MEIVVFSLPDVLAKDLLEVLYSGNIQWCEVERKWMDEDFAKKLNVLIW